ncbi:MAG: hypothetical protein QMC85_05795, partial [Methanocellales archaeon]|nr:hypothetical protein [Methanocellales archaeon]
SRKDELYAIKIFIYSTQHQEENDYISVIGRLDGEIMRRIIAILSVLIVAALISGCVAPQAI